MNLKDYFRPHLKRTSTYMDIKVILWQKTPCNWQKRINLKRTNHAFWNILIRVLEAANYSQDDLSNVIGPLQALDALMLVE